MLRKQYRLLTRLPAHSSRIYKIPYFTVRVSKNNVSVSRFGFVVSKKIDKRSVVRNKLKRQMSSCIQKHLGKIQQSLDMSFFLKKEVLGLPKEGLAEEIELFLKKEKLLQL